MKIEILVAMAPCIALAVLGFVVEVVPKLKRWLKAAMHSRSKVETLKELMSHTAFYGSILGGVFGFSKDSVHSFYLSAIWFLGFMYLAFKLAERADELEEYEEMKLHKKRAGLVRGIVRSELERVMTSKMDKDGT